MDSSGLWADARRGSPLSRNLVEAVLPPWGTSPRAP